MRPPVRSGKGVQLAAAPPVEHVHHAGDGGDDDLDGAIALQRRDASRPCAQAGGLNLPERGAVVAPRRHRTDRVRDDELEVAVAVDVRGDHLRLHLVHLDRKAVAQRAVAAVEHVHKPIEVPTTTSIAPSPSRSAAVGDE